MVALDETPYERHVQFTQLEEASFPLIIDYEVTHGSATPHRFALAFRSASTRANWRVSEAHFNLDMRESLRNDTKLEYYDSATMVAIQYPSRISESEHCFFRSLSSNGSTFDNIIFGLDDPCTFGHGLNPEKPDASASSFKVQESMVGDHAGRGVFAMEDIPANSYVGLDVSSNPVRCPWTSLEIIDEFQFSHQKMYQEFASVIFYYLEGYGFMDEPQVRYLAQAGLL